MADNLTRSKGENYSIQELSEMAAEGRLRIPEFQRSFRWDSSDVLALFDSILRGYPVGSVLLWKKFAPQKRLTLGALTIDAPEIESALWVVDGQQRITSLVNAVSSSAFNLDDRFRVVYEVSRRRFTKASDAKTTLSIPLPDLFDFARLLNWLQENPDAQDQATDIQNVTARLRDFKLPASVVDQADENVLRDIFDRMNTAGKRLRSAEIFDAIHRASGQESGDDLSIGAIADRISSSTTFGRIDDTAIYQAILVRRHPEITRDPHGEFDAERKLGSDFPRESRAAGYKNAEIALERTVAFLTDTAGVPHITFLPYRFLMLVLVRFFSLFPEPDPRNIELLGRWFWTAATRATELSLSGSTKTVRSLAGNIKSRDENGSVQRLFAAVEAKTEVPVPDVRTFRTNQAASKLVLCSFWALKPRSLVTGLEIESSELANALDGFDGPNEVAINIIPRITLGRNHKVSAANRLISVSDDPRTLEHLEAVEPEYVSSRNEHPNGKATRHEILQSHSLDESMVASLEAGQIDSFIEAREARLHAHLVDFISIRTAAGFEHTPPLASFDLDEDFDEDRDSVEATTVDIL